MTSVNSSVLGSESKVRELIDRCQRDPKGQDVWYLGDDRESGNPVVMQYARAHHLSIFGKNGSGRTGTAKQTLLASYLMNPSDEIYIIGGGHSFDCLADFISPSKPANEDKNGVSLKIAYAFRAFLDRIELFKIAMSPHLDHYRENTGNRLPRITLYFNDTAEALAAINFSENWNKEGSAAHMLNVLATTGRSFGIRLIFASQRKIEARLLRNTSKIVHTVDVDIVDNLHIFPEMANNQPFQYTFSIKGEDPNEFIKLTQNPHLMAMIKLIDEGEEIHWMPKREKIAEHSAALPADLALAEYAAEKGVVGVAKTFAFGVFGLSGYSVTPSIPADQWTESSIYARNPIASVEKSGQKMSLFVVNKPADIEYLTDRDWEERLSRCESVILFLSSYSFAAPTALLKAAKKAKKKILAYSGDRMVSFVARARERILYNDETVESVLAKALDDSNEVQLPEKDKFGRSI